MLPIVIIAVIVVPLLVVVFMQLRRRNAAGEDPGSLTSQAEIEREFAAAEAYQEEWREQQHAGPDHQAPGA